MVFDINQMNNILDKLFIIEEITEENMCSIILNSKILLKQLYCNKNTYNISTDILEYIQKSDIYSIYLNISNIGFYFDIIKTHDSALRNYELKVSYNKYSSGIEFFKDTYADYEAYDYSRKRLNIYNISFNNNDYDNYLYLTRHKISYWNDINKISYNYKNKMYANALFINKTDEIFSEIGVICDYKNYMEICDYNKYNSKYCKITLIYDKFILVNKPFILSEHIIDKNIYINLRSSYDKIKAKIADLINNRYLYKNIVHNFGIDLEKYDTKMLTLYKRAYKEEFAYYDIRLQMRMLFIRSLMN